MVGVAQSATKASADFATYFGFKNYGGRSSAWLERLAVAQKVGGSNPLAYPNNYLLAQRGEMFIALIT